MAKETIVVVEDEHDILELVAYNLEKEGYKVVPCNSGEEAIKNATRLIPDLILLDLMLPGVDGLNVCRRLKEREETKHIPIIMLTAKSEESDVVVGLELGADDYICKPFSPKILIARIRAALRRKNNNGTKPQEKIHIHGISIDTMRHIVVCDEKNIDLSATEFEILEFLALHPGWVFSRNQIIDSVKGKDYPVTERSVDVQILGLRRKLGARGSCIQTVRGVGYKMQEE